MCSSKHFYIPKQNKKIDENTFEFRENGIGNIIDLWVIDKKIKVKHFDYFIHSEVHQKVIL